MSVKEYPNVVPFTYWVHPSNYLEVQDNIYIKKCEVTIKKQPYIIAIKLSGVYWVVWNHTRDFKIPPSSIWNHKYVISDQNCTTRSSITTLLLKSQFQYWTSAQREFDLKSQVWIKTKTQRHEVQLQPYYIHFTCNLICYLKRDLKSVWLCCFIVPFSLAGKKMRFRAKNGTIWG